MDAINLDFEKMSERLQDLFELAGLGLSVEMFTHEFDSSIRSVRQKNQQIVSNRAAQTVDNLVRHINYVTYSLDALRKQMSYFNPGLKFVRAEKQIFSFKTRTRKWQQSSLFQKAFYEIVKQCIDSGLIDGEAMAADGSYIPANISRESWINVEIEVEQSMQSYLDSLDEELSNQPGFKKPPTKIVRKCRTTSQTDPDSGYINHGSKRGIGYLMEATVDCKHGILTGVDVYSANEKESVLILRHLERQINLGIPMSRLALDRGYETGAVHRGLELLGITGYIPAIQFSNPPEKYGFSYDPQLDAFICPEGVPLTYHRLNCSKSTGKYLRCYQVEGDACMRCPKRPGCFDKAGIRRRVLASSCYPAFFRGHQRVGTPEFLSMMRLRKIWAEGSFSVLKREHCISRIRKRGILAATEECLLAAMALNLKRMVNAIFRYLQIYCSAGTTVGFSRIFAFVNRSLIVHYPSSGLPSPFPSSISRCASAISAFISTISALSFSSHSSRVWA